MLNKLDISPVSPSVLFSHVNVDLPYSKTICCKCCRTKPVHLDARCEDESEDLPCLLKFFHKLDTKQMFLELDEQFFHVPSNGSHFEKFFDKFDRQRHFLEQCGSFSYEFSKRQLM